MPVFLLAGPIGSCEPLYEVTQRSLRRDSVCTQPLPVVAGQRLPGARTPPGHRLRVLLLGAGAGFPSGFPLVPPGPSFPHGSPAHSRACCLTLGRQLRVDSGLPTTPACLRCRRTPWPPSSCARSPTFPSSPGGRRIAPDLIPLAVPGLVSGLAALFTRRQRRVDSGLSTTPASLRCRRTPWPPSSCARPSTLSNSPGGRRITPDLILLAVPGARLSLAVLFTRPRRRLDSGRPKTPAACGAAAPPGASSDAARSRLSRPFPGGRSRIGSPS
jgi:hypothetical protein